MSEYRILKGNESGKKGILIEDDAGYVSPREFGNQDILKESKGFLHNSYQGSKQSKIC